MKGCWSRDALIELNYAITLYNLGKWEESIQHLKVCRTITEVCVLFNLPFSFSPLERRHALFCLFSFFLSKYSKKHTYTHSFTKFDSNTQEMSEEDSNMLDPEMENGIDRLSKFFVSAQVKDPSHL